VGYGNDELIVNVGDIYQRTVFATAQMNDGPDCLYMDDLVEVMYTEAKDVYWLVGWKGLTKPSKFLLPVADHLNPIQVSV